MSKARIVSGSLRRVGNRFTKNPNKEKQTECLGENGGKSGPRIRMKGCFCFVLFVIGEGGGIYRILGPDRNAKG